MAMDAAQTLTALYTHAGLDLESNIAILREAARDGEASTTTGTWSSATTPTRPIPGSRSGSPAVSGYDRWTRDGPGTSGDPRASVTSAPLTAAAACTSGTRPPPARRHRRRARTGSCMAGIPEDSEADDATRIFGRFLASMREGNIGNAWAPPARCPTGGEETLGRPGSRAAGAWLASRLLAVRALAARVLPRRRRRGSHRPCGAAAWRAGGVPAEASAPGRPACRWCRPRGCGRMLPGLRG
jgi:hypothetical protein